MFGRVLVLSIWLAARLVWASDLELEEGKSRLTGWREKITGIYQQQLSEPEAGLAAGMVLGVKTGLTKEFSQALVDTGTVHVVVASGYNVTVVGAIVFNSLIYLVKRRWASLGALMAIGGYVLVAGAEPPLVRAAVMGALVLAARGWGRLNQSGWLLFLAAWAMLMIKPGLVKSISFQLSVAATAGLIFLEPKIRRVIKWTELAPTLAAQVLTAPLIYLYFGRISWISPLVNVLVLPLVPPAMLFSALQAAGALVWQPLGQLLAVPSYALLHLFVVIVRWFG